MVGVILAVSTDSISASAGYGPVGRVGDGIESSPLAADRLGGAGRRQPRYAPDPARSWRRWARAAVTSWAGRRDRGSGFDVMTGRGLPLLVVPGDARAA